MTASVLASRTAPAGRGRPNDTTALGVNMASEPTVTAAPEIPSGAGQRTAGGGVPALGVTAGPTKGPGGRVLGAGGGRYRE